MNLTPFAKTMMAAYNEPPDIVCTRTDTQVVVRDGMIGFRGTTSLRDWMTNFQAGFAALRDRMLVHEGASVAWTSVQHAVFEEIRNQDNVEITGHSLGGQLALCMACDIAPYHDQVTVVTFGAPRLLHRSCYLPENVTHIRCANNCDIVPRVPMRNWGYTHSGECWYWDHEGHRVDLDGWKLWLDRVWGRVDDIGTIGTAGVNDHDRGEYYRLALEHDANIGDPNGQGATTSV